MKPLTDHPLWGAGLSLMTFVWFACFVTSQIHRGGKTLEGPSSFWLRLQSPHPVSPGALAPLRPEPKPI